MWWSVTVPASVVLNWNIRSSTASFGVAAAPRREAENGRRRDDGSAPKHPRRGSRSIAREAMQQLEAMGLLTKTDKKGRSISAQGRKLLDSLAHEILLELAKTNPDLMKYVGGA